MEVQELRVRPSSEVGSWLRARGLSALVCVESDICGGSSGVWAGILH